MPFYMLPFVFDSKITRDGLGGSKTMRGIMRNRVVGESMAFGTLELRYKFLRTVVFNQNLYIAISGFMDSGTVLKKYEFDTSGVPAGQIIYDTDESIHLSFGGGLHFALNENFVVAIDYGIAADKRDGTSGLYIGLNWLF